MKVETPQLPFFDYRRGGPVIASSQKVVLSLLHLQASMLRGALRYQIAALDFLRRRFEQDAKLVNALVSRQEFDDFHDSFADFMGRAACDYSEEISKAAAIGSEIATDMAKRARKDATETLEDIATERLPL